MLYCPQCGAEYRDGFTSCSDCQVPLACERPPACDQDSLPEPGDLNRDPFCAFWQGDDPYIHAELCRVLDESGIQHKTVHRQDHLFNLSNSPAFQLGVPASRFEEAENAVREAFSTDSDGVDAAETLTLPRLVPDRRERIQKLPEMLSPEENIPGPEAPGDAADWFREDAVALVWSGDDMYLATAILAALNENDLHVRRELRENASHLFVFPGEKARAREIIRQIIESSPPE